MSFIKTVKLSKLFAESSAEDEVVLLADTNEQPEDSGSFWDAILPSGSCVVVDSSGTDEDRGVALVAAYEKAKLLTPGGNALSATNRATVVIPPGKYRLLATLEIDADFVDFIALMPETPPDRKETDSDPFATAVPLSNYRPTSTVVYSDTAQTTVMDQSSNDVKMVGFTIAQLDSTNITPTGSWFGLKISSTTDAANDASVYERMNFFSRCVTNQVNTLVGSPVGAVKNLKGTWRNCVANGYAWRFGASAETGEFAPQMYDCQFGTNSCTSDWDNDFIGACTIVRCKGVGIDQDNTVSGSQCFGGCTSFGCPITSDAYFYDVKVGDKSFALSKNCDGNFYRCEAGEKSFGYVTNGQTGGTYTGYAENCISGSGSFGGSENLSVGGCNGTLVDCVISDDNCIIRRASGLKATRCRLNVIRSDRYGFRLYDSNCVFKSCEIIVDQGGTGIPIYATSPLNVVVVGCVMNNASNDADGLDANVTNLVASPNNVVSDSVS